MRNYTKTQLLIYAYPFFDFITPIAAHLHPYMHSPRPNYAPMCDRRE